MSDADERRAARLAHTRFYVGMYDWLISRCYAAYLDDIGRRHPDTDPTPTEVGHSR